MMIPQGACQADCARRQVSHDLVEAVSDQISDRAEPRLDDKRGHAETATLRKPVLVDRGR